MAELTTLVSYGPDSVFASTADDRRGRSNVTMLLIRSGRGCGDEWQGQQRTIFNEIVCYLKNQNQHNTTTNLSFEGASRTPSWRNGWEDNEPTRGSKLHELTEIEGDDCLHERKSHCCGLLWSSAKMGSAWYLPYKN